MIGASEESRSLKKFLRHKPAMISFVVIMVYFAVAAAVILGDLVSVEDCERRYGPKSTPGFGVRQLFEKELQDITWYAEQIEQKLKLRQKLSRRIKSRGEQPENEDIEQELRGLRIGNLAPANISAAQLQMQLDGLWDTVSELDEYDDLNDGGADTATIGNLISTADEQMQSLFADQSGSEARHRKLHLLFGTDVAGRSIFLRSIYSIRVAVLVGVVTGLISVTIGALLGLAAGYFGGWIDGVVTWLYSTFASIPNIVMLMVLAYMFRGGEIDAWLNGMTGDRFAWLIGGTLDQTLIPVFVAFSATFWIGPCRVIRGETLKLRETEYVQAAQVMGYSRMRILLRHILPNISHLMLINFSLLFIGAIKSEVILSFLGIGVQSGASWGLMIDAARDEVLNDFFWQIGAATALMFGLVLAFNILSDALQDILDPKHV
ncbi:MAG: ABC transporter permease [Fuerstiella sp.]|jgi:peptide/nickel transport system permease protein|nr:ABC transporter permease [Fuerstiella sp.]